MAGTRFPKNVCGLLVLTACAQSVYYFPLLPGRVASHFAGSGAPNGWMSKQGFFAVYAGLIVVAACMVFGMPYWIAHMSAARVNLPNKEYWFSPAHRAETIGFFEKFFAWYGSALLLFEIFVIELALQANLSAIPRLPAGRIVMLVSCFAFFNIVWILRLLRRFSNRE